MKIQRIANRIAIVIKSGQTDSPPINIGDGSFGTFIIPTGSPLVGRTLQIVATDDPTIPGVVTTMPDTALLSTPKNIAAAGAVALTSSDISECGAAGWVKFRASSAVGADALFFLLWKS